jgi:hypothetical protein
VIGQLFVASFCLPAAENSDGWNLPEIAEVAGIVVTEVARVTGACVLDHQFAIDHFYPIEMPSGCVQSRAQRANFALVQPDDLAVRRVVNRQLACRRRRLNVVSKSYISAMEIVEIVRHGAQTVFSAHGPDIDQLADKEQGFGG